MADQRLPEKADTIEELAQACGIDPAGLAATVKRFNTYAVQGSDPDFHRGEGAHERYQGDYANTPNASLGPVQKGPFYAVELYPGDVGTSGGLLCDEYARVLGHDHTPIPGLYAAGNATASVMGRAYLGAGASIGASFVFSHIAMKHAARQANAIQNAENITQNTKNTAQNAESTESTQNKQDDQDDQINQAERSRGPVVHVDPLGVDLELEPGETIIEAAWRLGYHWPTVCHAQAECTVCHIEILSGADHLIPPEHEEQDALEHRLPGAHRRDLTRLRLACRAQATGDVTVRKNGVRRRETPPAIQPVRAVNE